ncbi:hypothetical protein VNO80_24567 [Phaseolus coccineus]|uniref:Uncharacterized protein n=1 Tax=Phaseolus coccineus TaxID=3886 RepID=A0AAN9QL52_PHACN
MENHTYSEASCPCTCRIPKQKTITDQFVASVAKIKQNFIAVFFVLQLKWKPDEGIVVLSLKCWVPSSELQQLQLQGLGEAMEYLMVKIMILATVPLYSLAVDIPLVRQVVSKYNVSCILVFWDSSVDSGNNNALHTTMKRNCPP